MNKTDLAALSLAIETQRKREPAHRTQIDNMLRREPWESVGRFAAYSCQCDSLNLAPWETPPIWIDDIGAALNAPEDGKCIRSAALLLQRMLALRISQYHPSPLAAIEMAENKTATSENLNSAATLTRPERRTAK